MNVGTESNMTQLAATESLGKELLVTPKAAATCEPCGDKSMGAKLPELTLDILADADKEKLNTIYKNATAGDIPEGETAGRAITLPGTKFGDFLSNIEERIWKGKVFSPDGDLVNKILGHNLVHADVRKGTSWFDGKESIIIDYKDKSHIAGFVRDEIREVQPGLYLGKMYARLPFGQRLDTLFFALETNKNS